MRNVTKRLCMKIRYAQIKVPNSLPLHSICSRVSELTELPDRK